MFIFGTITTTNMATYQAETQVNPGISGFQTVLATIGGGSYLLYLVQMCTLFRHLFFLSDQKWTASLLKKAS